MRPTRRGWVSRGIVPGSTKEVLVFCKVVAPELGSPHSQCPGIAFRSEPPQGRREGSLRGRVQVCELCLHKGTWKGSQWRLKPARVLRVLLTEPWALARSCICRRKGYLLLFL